MFTNYKHFLIVGHAYQMIVCTVYTNKWIQIIIATKYEKNSDYFQTTHDKLKENSFHWNTIYGSVWYSLKKKWRNGVSM